MRALKLCLYVGGILCLLSVIGVFLPISTWGKIAKLFGAEFTLPDSPLFEYMVRLTCATYVGAGVYFIILARNPLKYTILIPFTGIASVALGLACMITGSLVDMPVMWFLGDALSGIVLGILILVFWQQAKCASSNM